MGTPPPAPPHPLRVDGALLDNFRLRHGFREAKDPPDAPEHIVRFLAQAIIVGVETVKVVKGLPPLEK